MTIQFYDSIEDSLLKFAVIVAKHREKWVFCRHKQRNTLEIAGGHREKGESIDEAARRELFEETGAKEYSIIPICVYSVTGKNRINQRGEELFGMLYFADIQAFGTLPPSEMEAVVLQASLPKAWTYPDIQPALLDKVISLMGTA